jgi:hypothetical protein
VEKVHQEVDRLRFHADTFAQGLTRDSDLGSRALEHLEQALENLQRAYELGKEARRRLEDR